MPGIYKEQLPAIANRIIGEIRGVSNSRRQYISGKGRTSAAAKSIRRPKSRKSR